jgi:hypothetical protein
MTIRRTVAMCTLAFGLACAASPAFAQSGQIKGKVTDAQGAVVEGAKVLIENLDKGSKAIETKTNKKGEHIQVGLYPGSTGSRCRRTPCRRRARPTSTWTC